MHRRLFLACLLLLSWPSWAADKLPEELEKDVARLRDWLRGPSADRWLRAAKEAKDLAPISKPLLPELCLLTLNSSKPIRQAAFEAIEVIDRQLYDALLGNDRLDESRFRMRSPEGHLNALRDRLLHLGIEAAPAAGMMLKLGDYATAAEIAPDDLQVLDHVLKVASTRVNRRKGLQALVLMEIDEKHQSKAIDLMILGVKEGHVRIVSKRLGQFGSDAKRAIPALRDAKGSVTSIDRQAAADALESIELSLSIDAKQP